MYGVGCYPWSVLHVRQNEQREHIEIMANHGLLSDRVKMITDTSSYQPCV